MLCASLLLQHLPSQQSDLLSQGLPWKKQDCGWSPWWPAAPLACLHPLATYVSLAPRLKSILTGPAPKADATSLDFAEGIMADCLMLCL